MLGLGLDARRWRRRRDIFAGGAGHVTRGLDLVSRLEERVGRVSRIELGVDSTYGRHCEEGDLEHLMGLSKGRRRTWVVGGGVTGVIELFAGAGSGAFQASFVERSRV